MTVESMDEWDFKVKPVLAGVRLDCGWLKFYASKVRERIASLPSRPGFETEAEATMLVAIQCLEECLHTVETSLEAYKEVPVK
jgi:hypothetical protein